METLGTTAESLDRIVFLVVSSLLIYLLVFITHALRRRITQAPLFALLGCLAAVTVWVTDTATRIQVGPYIFLYGSVVFFIAMLLGVFLSYVFDGTHSGQYAIASIVGMTLLTPIFAKMTGYQGILPGTFVAYPITEPSLTMYILSAGAMFVDFIVMTVTWQFLVNIKYRVPIIIYVFIALLAALWADALIFTTAVFHGDDAFLGILRANIISRLILALLLSPILAAYVKWEIHHHGMEFARRPLLAILQSSSRTEQELSSAQKEIQRRREAERALEDQLQFRESLMESLPYPVFYKDTDGRYLGGNTAFFRDTGLRREEVIGKSADELFPPEVATQYNTEDEQLLRQPGIHSYETTSLNRDGTKKDVILCKSTYLANDGTIAGILGILIDISDRKELEDKLQELALRDPLTGALNRRAMMTAINDEIARAGRYRGMFSLVLMDADRFKAINDKYGHAAGDEVLKHITRVCKSQCRENDSICRWGGEEFAILMLGANIDAAKLVAERIRGALASETIPFDGHQLTVTASIGVAEYGAHIEGAEDLLHQADVAMYSAKNAGGNRVEVGLRPA